MNKILVVLLALVLVASPALSAGPNSYFSKKPKRVEKVVNKKAPSTQPAKAEKKKSKRFNPIEHHWSSIVMRKILNKKNVVASKKAMAASKKTRHKTSY
ncbi:MAG: hypothetical protein JKX97_05135 [Candidatus Lindowbacteria bacterium]|nr:hypothetical protein [Candidatus Lindowbacteria bacterium]